MPLSKQDRDRIAAAIRQAEANTSGQIVCVLARAASNYAFVPIIWASLLALATPWPLIAFTTISVERIYLAQLAVFAVAVALLSIPRLRMLLVPRHLQRLHAHHAALEQFMARGLTHTRGRSGVLIFVSLAERYVRIIADEGIATRVPQSVWQEAVHLLLAEMRHGRIAEGFAEAIAACGRVLAAHFPPRDEGANELPDRIYVM
ncbi:MAG: TPM domain-containing protein [Methylobacteriaceae bacterium]|nr:TPM domain-containing protein [Methylobacteriaceae bacterium]MBV9704099.1 TPM domain-containing protein [Methylobacteriaceae bacterium]